MASYQITREAWLRNQKRFQAAVRGDWTWPFDTTVYENRSGILSQAECDALSTLIGHFEMKQRRLSSQMIIAAVNEETPLTRLIRPLCDLLDVIGVYSANRFMTLRVLLQEIHRNQQTYWAWSQETWIHMLYPDTKLFQQHYHTTSGPRPYLIAASYLISDCVDFRPLNHVSLISLANMIFGEASVKAAVQRVETVLQQWGKRTSVHFPQLIAQILLANHSPLLQDVRREVLANLYATGIAINYKAEFVKISRVLTSLGNIEEPIERPLLLPRPKRRRSPRKHIAQSQQIVLPSDVPSEWANLCQHWYQDTSTALTPATRRAYYCYLLKVGRWLQQTHPHAGDPSLWTSDLAEECVKTVNDMRVGQWTNPKRRHRWAGQNGRLLARETRDHYLLVLLIFFQDCVQREWVTLQFDPNAYFLSASQIAVRQRQT